MKSGFVKKVRLPLAATIALTAFSAEAADMYTPQASMKDAGIYATPGWAGFYLGVNGGYGWSAAQSDLADIAYHDWDASIGGASSNFSANGGFGGGQLGYNLQRDRIVFGVEADIQAAHMAGSAFAEANNGDGDVITDAWARSTLDWFGTLRGRLGYSFGSSLFYATAGFAFGGVRDSLNQSVSSYWAPGTGADSGGKSTTLTGYAVGGGAETAITPAWSVKAEYQYIDLGSTYLSTNNDISYTCGEGSCTDSGGAAAKFSHTYHTVRLGLNYKLGQTYEPLK